MRVEPIGDGQDLSILTVRRNWPKSPATRSESMKTTKTRSDTQTQSLPTPSTRKRPARWSIWNSSPDRVTERRLFRGDEYLARAWRHRQTEWRWELSDKSAEGAAFRQSEAEDEAKAAAKRGES